MSLSRAHLHVRCLQSCGILAALSPRRVVDRRDGAGMPPPRVLCRGIFGKVAGSSHSKVLSSPSDGIAQIQVLTLQPKYTEDYLKLASEYIPKMIANTGLPVKLVGAWTTLIGSQTNTATHIWEYKNFDDVQETLEKLKEDKSWQEFTREQGKFVSASSSQIILPFTFFHSIESTSNKEQSRIFELRSYQLKPGSMIQWGQEWAQGIQYRREEAVGGWFSQIGNMHTVYHLWVYKSLKDRDNTRLGAWAFPGWDECVRRTVPLIQHMESSILLPTDYSPLQ